MQTTLQALFGPEHLTGVVVQGFRSSSLSATQECYLVESRRPLCFGSSQANRSVFNTLSRHSPLAAVSSSMPIISLRLGSSASLSSPFSSSCYVGSYCSVFPSCLSCLLSSSGYMNQHAMWKYCIAHKWGRVHIYTEYARTKHIYQRVGRLSM